MRHFLLLSALFLSEPVLGAVDYSGCVPQSLIPGQSPEYNLTQNGRLAGGRTKGSADTITGKTEGGGRFTYELQRGRDGRPQRLTYVYPRGTSGDTGQITRFFAYDSRGRCYLNEMVNKGESGMEVTYNHQMCEDVGKQFERLKKKIDACGEVYREIVDTLGKYDQAFRKQKKSLFGYSEKRFEENPFNAALGTLSQCASIRGMYPYNYAKRFGDFHLGNMFYFPGLFDYQDQTPEERAEQQERERHRDAR